MDNKDPKLVNLLSVVIDNYISKWEPIWSKFLHSLDWVDYAPSTLRKYLNVLEKAWFVYQPYNSSGRIPTVDWLAVYLDTYIQNPKKESDPIELELGDARWNLRNIVESLWKIADGVVVWFLRNDEYFFLWINNLLMDKTTMDEDFATTRHIIDFIEKKEIIWFLSSKIIKKQQTYYSFIQQNDEVTFSCLYSKVNVNDYDGIIAIVWPTRVDYKKNLSILKKLVELVG